MFTSVEPGADPSSSQRESPRLSASGRGLRRETQHMGYGIGGILILILVILAIIYFAKRV